MVKVYIDPGHGGVDSGAVGHGLKEKDLTLKIALKMKKLLSSYNVDVKLSRETDKTITLSERTRDANRWKADLFVSLHINAGGGTGYEDYIYIGLGKGKTSDIRDIVHSEIVKAIGSEIKIRGKKKANFHVLRETVMSSILTENLFIDNKQDAEKLKDDKFLEKVAQGHVNGIVKALSLKKKKRQIVNKTSNNKKTSQSTSYKGRRVESIHDGHLRFYNKPSWDDKDVFGYLKKGEGFPEIISKHKVGNGYQYKVKNSKGSIFYVTASPKYVKVV